MDLRAHLPDGPVGISPGEVQLIPTGLVVELEGGYEGQVRPRSGLAVKHRVTVLNSPGTIDSDYRGEVKVILINHGNTTFVVEDQERIAQFVVGATPRVSVLEVEESTTTERGSGGFGSTGKS
jgi:dUTP pyrophosphatase